MYADIFLFPFQTQGHEEFLSELRQLLCFIKATANSVLQYLSVAEINLKKRFCHRGVSPDVLPDLISSSLSCPHIYTSLQLLLLLAV